jgi:signal transduction histidine kinase
VRRRITVAMLGLVAGTLVLTAVGGLVLVRRSATSTAEGELAGQAQSLGQLLEARAAAATDQTLIRVLKKVGSYEYLRPVGLSPAGVFQTLPVPLTTARLDVGALQSGQTVSGAAGDMVFAAVPITLSRRERAVVGIPIADSPVLLVTRQVTNPVNGLPYFLLVGAAVLIVGVVVSALLARRISAPLVRAVDATRKIAAGDLQARVELQRGDDPELAGLGLAINSLGESLSRSRGLERQFVLSVSHEFRTPLTSIRGYADAIVDEATDDPVRAAKVITGEARRLERLVQDLLDLARLDARQFSLDVQRVDAGAIAHLVAEGFRPEALSLGIELSTTPVSGDGVWVDADPDRLGQIVSNLIENAFKFARAHVEVGAAVSEGSAGLWVSDDGPGIAAEDLPRVFERHFSSDRGVARRVGSGLGLAIVAELANAMGATLKVESPLVTDHGTRVVVWLPARTGHDSSS